MGEIARELYAAWSKGAIQNPIQIMNEAEVKTKVIVNYLISLWTVCLLQWGQNFLISNRAVVLRRFLLVVYRDTPGERLLVLLRHSVHSTVMIMRAPFLLAMVVFFPFFGDAGFRCLTHDLLSSHVSL